MSRGTRSFAGAQDDRGGALGMTGEVLLGMTKKLILHKMNDTSDINDINDISDATATMTTMATNFTIDTTNNRVKRV